MTDQTSEEQICDVCGVDHRTTSADLSHGIVYLLEHAQERFPWMEHPINGDHVALQRAGILPPSMLWSTDWEQLGEQDGAWIHHNLNGFLAHVKHGLWKAAEQTQTDFALAGPSKGGTK